jgi:hypothetical protein
MAGPAFKKTLVTVLVYSWIRPINAPGVNCMEKSIIDEIMSEFDLELKPGKDREQLEGITFWIPLEYKEKYDLLQTRTKQRFGKVLKEIIKRSIDRAASGS